MKTLRVSATSWGIIGRGRYWLVCALLVLLPVLSQAAPEPGPGPYNLTLFHTNDSHSYVFPRPATWRDDGRLVGGIVPLAWRLEQERRETNASILLDAGDFMTGNPVCEFAPDGVPGEAIARLMNQLGYDAGTIGNHEFDIGQDNLVRLVKLFDYPLIAADILDTEGNPVFRAEPLILERGGLKVGILGVSCAGMEEVVSPSRFAGLAMGPQVEIVRHQAAELDPQTDLLILLTHNGVGDDKELARQLEGSGVDILVGGHSHSRLKNPLLEGGILIVQAGSKFTNLGRLDLQVADDRVISYNGQLLDLWADEAQASPELTALADGYQAQVQQVYGRSIGTLETAWEKGRGETNLGNFLADGIRTTAAADVAFINSGGIRKELSAGPVTALDIHEILPFSNTIVVVELTDRQLAAIAQQNADAEVNGKHGILQISGLSYSYRANSDQTGAVLEDVLVQGKPLAPGGMYRVAMPDFVAMMQDVYLKIDLPEVQDLGVTLSRAIVDVVEAAGTIDSRIEGRIRRLD
jgi:5'-nucleotidase/UDP-sugar diphosphatase